MIHGTRVSNRMAEVAAILQLMQSKGIRTDWDTVDGLETGAIIFQHANEEIAAIIVVNRTGYEFLTEEEYLNQDEGAAR